MNSTTPDALLPFSRPDIGEREIEAVVEVMREGWLTTGPRAALLERRFAEQLGVRHALAVNSATSGLHLALEAVGVGPGDLVVTTPYTFTATADAIRYLGADPLLADIDAGTLTLDPARVSDLLDDLKRHQPARYERVRALLPVHYAGQACDMGALLGVARAHGLAVVEDAAHAFPCTCEGTPVGRLGDVTVFSFYATKPIATGEGGMITTQDEGLAARMRLMRLHGIDRDAWDRHRGERPAWYYQVVAPGFRYNLGDLAAAIGLVQLARADALHQGRSRIARAYRRDLGDLPGLELLHLRRPDDVHAWHLFPVFVNPARRDAVVEALRARGVGCSVHYIPLHLHPYYRERYGWAPADFPVSRARFEQEISLPLYTRMSDQDVARVVAAVRAALAATGEG